MLGKHFKWCGVCVCVCVCVCSVVASRNFEIGGPRDSFRVVYSLKISFGMKLSQTLSRQ